VTQHEGADLAQRLLSQTALPRSNGEPVFAEPWQARVFAMAGALAGAGICDWSRLEPLLGSDDQPADFERWLDLLESTLEDQGLVSAAELHERTGQLAAADRHEH